MISSPVEDDTERTRPLPGDERVPDAKVQITHAIPIDATPEEIWPRLVEMAGCDGRDRPSVGIAAGVSVLRMDEPRALVLGALFDHAAHRYVPFDGPRPEHFWQASWALVLESLDDLHTVVHARSRVAYTFDAVQWAAVWMHPFNDHIGHEDLRRLKVWVEGSIDRPL